MFKFNKKATIIILLLILFLGGFLRFYKLGSQSYWMDEGYTVNAVISGQENGFTRTGASILDSGQTYACPLYCLPTAIIAKYLPHISAGTPPFEGGVGGGSDWPTNAFNFRILAAIFGILAILAVFLTTKQLFNNDRVSLLAAFFMATSYWQIAWSRQARWYTELELFFWLALLCFFVFIHSKSSPVIPSESANRRSSRGIPFFQFPIIKKKIIFFILTIIFTILAILTHKVAILLPFIFVAWLIIKDSPLLRGVPEAKRKAGCVLDSKKIALSIILILLPFIIFPKFFVGAINNIHWSYNLPYYLNFYFRNYFLFIILAIFYYFSLSKNSLKVQSSKFKIIFLTLLFVLYLIPLSFLTGIVHYRYLFQLTPIFFILGAAAIIGLGEKIGRISPPLGEGAGGGKNYKQIIFISAIILLFFIFKQGVLIPQAEYFLESDNPAKGNRPYYAYTPQPDFKWAYQTIKDNKKPGEIVISSHPHFNKIFLNEPGYWLKYSYLGFEDDAGAIANDREYYVGAKVIDDLAELQGLVGQNHGYIVFDYMAQDGRIDPKIINYIESNTNYAPASYEMIGQSLFELLFSFQTNYYSRIWVYKF